MVFDEQFDKACSMAAGYLSRYSKTKAELKEYLKKKKIEEKYIDSVAAKCEEYGYLNDKSFAKNYVEFKGKSHSERQIKFNLLRKGIDEDVVSGLDFDDAAATLRLAQKFFAKKERTSENILKLKSSLARKGFGFEDINRAVSLVLEEVNDLEE